MKVKKSQTNRLSFLNYLPELTLLNTEQKLLIWQGTSFICKNKRIHFHFEPFRIEGKLVVNINVIR